MKKTEYVLLHVFAFDSSVQLFLAIFLLFVMSFFVVVLRIKREKNNKEKNKNSSDSTETDEQDKIKCNDTEPKKSTGTKKSGLEKFKNKRFIIQIKKKIKKFFDELKKQKIGIIKKVYEYIVDSYARLIKEKALTGLFITIFISIIFLLLINSIWEFLYDDVKILSLDSRLSSGEALELFVNTVVSLLLAVMAWRLDMNLRDKDENDHKLEITSKRKRELAENELKAEFIYTVKDNAIACRIVMKNKNHSTVLPPYLEVINKNDDSDEPTIKANINIQGNSFVASYTEITAEQICIEFADEGNAYISNDFFLAPIYCDSVKNKLQFFIDLSFSVVDNSTKIKTEIKINSHHIFKNSAPLIQLEQSTFLFDCDVVSKLNTDRNND